MDGKNVINKVGRIVVALVIALLIESVCFHFNYIVSKIDSSKRYNVKYTLDEMIKVNWTENDGVLISKPDPQLIIEDVNTYVEKIQFSYSVNGTMDAIVVFYSNEEIPEINGELLKQTVNIGENKTEIEIGDFVNTLRIDPGDNADNLFQDIEITINPVDFHLSMSRVIAMLLIYLAAKGLFALQKPLDYNLD